LTGTDFLCEFNPSFSFLISDLRKKPLYETDLIESEERKSGFEILIHGNWRNENGCIMKIIKMGATITYP
jgi:hypothetical protein